MKLLRIMALGSIVVAAMLFTFASVTATNVGSVPAEIAADDFKKKDSTNCKDKDGNTVAYSNDCIRGKGHCIDNDCPTGSSEVD